MIIDGMEAGKGAEKGSTNRRNFLLVASSLGAALAIRRAVGAGENKSTAPTLGKRSDHWVQLVEFTNAGGRRGIVAVEKIAKTEEEWKKQLTPEQFHVTRKNGTEPAFTGKYWNHHEKGVYRCVCCGNALFSSDTKFESGTGWPSFWAPIAAENIRSETDFSFGILRSEVLCAKCDAHLGHIFEDGPKPTGLRYCMNSASLDFAKGAGK